MLERIHNALSRMDQACRALGRRVNIMEVCGTHTVSIFRNGIKSVLPAGVRMLSGPGCPVCVTDAGYLDIVLSLADDPGLIIATYGDLVRVPGTNGSLERKPNKNIKVVLSSTDALQLARDNPDKTVIFLAVGFETTTPATAVVVGQAAELGVENFTVLSAHKRILPAMQALLSEKNHKIDAFLCPGHVSVIIGLDAYRPIVRQFARPCVVAGFEPVQIIEGLAEICQQLAERDAQVKSVYGSVVSAQGNTIAQQLIEQCFEAADGWWRGIGKIEQSTFKLKDRYRKFDAFARFNVQEEPAKDTTGCRCGEILCGLIDPPQCTMFGETCVPETPVGPCMVSSEGTCAAWFKYAPREKPVNERK